MERRRCQHPRTTLCQHVDRSLCEAIPGEKYGWFVCYQCDDCGQITRKEVTAEDLERTDLPWLDEDMYAHATDEERRGQADLRGLLFFEKAANSGDIFRKKVNGHGKIP